METNQQPATEDVGKTIQHQTVGEAQVIASSQYEIQSAMVLAKKFPRDEEEAQKKILKACKRPGLAKQGLYVYSRGGTEIKGGTIRLLEEAARIWGNVNAGVTELSNKKGVGNVPGESVMQAYAIDLENNVKFSSQFTVRHFRNTKQGGKVITDERDVYEMVANMASRRLRTCLERIIPGDILDEAEQACEQTMIDIEKKESQGKSDQEMNEKMAKGFAVYGVTKEMIAKRVQKNFEAINATDRHNLSLVFNSIKNGLGQPGQFFEGAGEAIDVEATDVTEPAPQPPPAPKSVKNFAPQTHKEAVARQEQKEFPPEPAFPQAPVSKPPREKKVIWDDICRASSEKGWDQNGLEKFTTAKNIKLSELWKTNDISGLEMLLDLVKAADAEEGK